MSLVRAFKASNLSAAMSPSASNFPSPPLLGSPVLTGSKEVRWPSTWTTRTLMAILMLEPSLLQAFSESPKKPPAPKVPYPSALASSKFWPSSISEAISPPSKPNPLTRSLKPSKVPESCRAVPMTPRNDSPFWGPSGTFSCDTVLKKLLVPSVSGNMGIKALRPASRTSPPGLEQRKYSACPTACDIGRPAASSTSDSTAEQTIESSCA
mmetsp:Transcript_10485/g.25366  ORF Transcript_10485/g.25366 Transcript_10485/m.25366 type:complete len:210 (-) Transcript_10485:1077-1706(-)